MNDITMHRCKDLAVSDHQPDNANYIKLTIKNTRYGVIDDGFYASVATQTTLSLFGLPVEVTDKLIAAFGEKEGAES